MLEQNKPADELIEALRQAHKRKTGEDLPDSELLAQAITVLKERIAQ